MRSYRFAIPNACLRHRNLNLKDTQEKDVASFRHSVLVAKRYPRMIAAISVHLSFVYLRLLVYVLVVSP